MAEVAVSGKVGTHVVTFGAGASTLTEAGVGGGVVSGAVVGRIGEVEEASGGVGLETGEGDSIGARRGLWGVVSSAGKRGEEPAG